MRKGLVRRDVSQRCSVSCNILTYTFTAPITPSWLKHLISKSSSQRPPTEPNVSPLAAGRLSSIRRAKQKQAAQVVASKSASAAHSQPPVYSAATEPKETVNEFLGRLSANVSPIVKVRSKSTTSQTAPSNKPEAPVSRQALVHEPLDEPRPPQLPVKDLTMDGVPQETSQTTVSSAYISLTLCTQRSLLGASGPGVYF